MRLGRSRPPPRPSTATVLLRPAVFGRPLTLTLLARRSRHFAGTRFKKRGISDQGKVCLGPWVWAALNAVVGRGIECCGALGVGGIECCGRRLRHQRLGHRFCVPVRAGSSVLLQPCFRSAALLVNWVHAVALSSLSIL